MRTTLALLTVVVSTGCGRLGFESTASIEVGPDSGGPDTTDAGEATTWNLGPFSPPTVMTTLSASDHEHAASMTADLLEVVFESRASGNDDLWSAKRTSPSAPWSPPVRISELSTEEIDSAAAISADGLALWFTSGTTLRETTRASRSAPWLPSHPSELSRLATGLVFAAAPTPSTLAMVVQVKTSRGDSDLSLATRTSTNDPWGPLQPLPGINTASNDIKGFISEDLCSLFFASDRPQGRGGFDLYFATRESVTSDFDVTPIPELASIDMDADPWVSPDGRILMFASYRDVDEGMALYEARR